MCKRRHENWAVFLLLLLHSPCLAFEPPPLVLSPDAMLASKPTLIRDYSPNGPASVYSEIDETLDVGIGPNGGAPKTCRRRAAAHEALNLFMKRSPLFGDSVVGEIASSSADTNWTTSEEDSMAISSDGDDAMAMVTPPTPASSGVFNASDSVASDGTTAPPSDSPTLETPSSGDLDPTRGLLEGADDAGHAEDMPSFNEWAKKRLEEQALPNGQFAASKGHTMTAKKNRHKNYASVDCGAKVLASNAESQSASAVLSHDQDDYMLNPCTARAWLVLELCEAVQLERLELANFELFSSSPRHFSVHSGDRYPTRDWNFIGTFEAIDEKTAQSFALHQTSFSKYVKIELVSHYGTEHFCPLSLVRVYGTSEYEALDTEEQTTDDQQGSSTSLVNSANSIDGDANLASPTASPTTTTTTTTTATAATAAESTNLFGSAKEAVLTMVKKAAAVLSPRNTTDTLASSSTEDVMPSLTSGKNCRSLIGVSNVDWQAEGLSGVKTACNRSVAEQSLNVLACDYDKFATILRQLRRRIGGPLMTVCSDACSPYVSAKFELAAGQSSFYACTFYVAVLGAVRFGALCNLDKLNFDSEGSRLIGGWPPPPPSSSVAAHLVKESGAPVVDITEASQVSIASSTPNQHLGAGGSGGGQGHGSSMAALEFMASLLSGTPPLNVGTLSGKTLGMETLDGVPLMHAMNDVIFTDKIDYHIAGAENLQIRPTPSGEKHEASRSEQSGACSQSPGTIESSASHHEVSSNDSPVKIDRLSVTSSDPSAPKDASNLTLSGDHFLLSSERLPPPLPVSPSFSAGSESKESAKFSSLPSSRVDVARDASASKTVFVGGEFSTIAEHTYRTNGASADGFGGTTGFAPSSPPPSPNGTADAKPSALHGGIVGSFSTPGQKESVFVRLSNRIKALELNMSLSGQYLEELSRRYRKQMEEMQRAFNKTIGALNETARLAHERDLKQQDVIGILQSQLNTLSKVVSTMAEQQESLHSQVIARHLVLMMVEVVLVTAVFVAACFLTNFRRSRLLSLSSAVVSRISPTRELGGQKIIVAAPTAATPIRALAGRPPDRRSSDPNLAAFSPCALLGDRRRPSSEALNVSGTYSDLLIVEPKSATWVDRPLHQKEFDQQFKKPKRKKNRNRGGVVQQSARGVEVQQHLYRSVSNDALASKPLSTNSRKVSAADNDDDDGRELRFGARKARSSSKIEDIPLDRNYCDDGFEEESVWTDAKIDSTTTSLNNNRLGNSKRRWAEFDRKRVSIDAAGIDTTTTTTEEATKVTAVAASASSLVASSRQSLAVYAAAANGGLSNGHDAVVARREGYINRLKKLSQKVY